MIDLPGIPAWFWPLIADCRPSLDALAAWLDSASQAQIEQYAEAYFMAATAIADAWDGPSVDDIPFSEDDTEDFCHWVVGQGLPLWERAMAERDDLAPLVRIYWRAERGELPEYPVWGLTGHRPELAGWLSPNGIAYAIYEARFDENLYEVLN